MRWCKRVRVAPILIALVVAGCVEAPAPLVYVEPDMVARVSPAKPPQSESRFGEQAVVVAQVTRIGASSGNAGADATQGPSTSTSIPGTTFREALIQSLQVAALFSSVSPTGKSRYILSAEIRQQAAYSYGATVGVRYVLSDTQLGREILNEYLVATYSFPLHPGVVFVPGQTPTVAIERACAKNFALLIARLANLNDYSTE